MLFICCFCEFILTSIIRDEQGVCEYTNSCIFSVTKVSKLSYIGCHIFQGQNASKLLFSQVSSRTSLGYLTTILRPIIQMGWIPVHALRSAFLSPCMPYLYGSCLLSLVPYIHLFKQYTTAAKSLKQGCGVGVGVLFLNPGVGVGVLSEKRTPHRPYLFSPVLKIIIPYYYFF